MIQDFLDEVLSDVPKYTLRDGDGNVLNDDVDIALKTPILQEGTPLNRQTFRNLQGDLYTADRYSEVSVTLSTTEVADVFKLAQLPLDNTSTIHSIGYGSGTCVIPTTTGFAISDDMETWTPIEFEKDIIYDIASDDQQTFCAVSYSYRRIYTSTDKGRTWNETYYSSSTGHFLKIAYGNGVFVATGSATNPFMVVSNDGINWTTATYPATDNGRVFFFGGLFRIIDSRNNYYTSADGTTWTNQGTTTIFPLNVVKHPTLDRWFATANTTSIYRSDNYTTWTACATVNYNVRAIAHGGNEIVVSGNSGYISELDPTTGALRKQENMLNGETSYALIFDGKRYIISASSDVYKTQYKTDYFFESDTSLTSYEKGKVINIEGGRYQDTDGNYITSFVNPYININNLGEKKINGTINYGKNYSLLYNGESFDVISSRVVTGTFKGSLSTINLPFTPDLVICYNSNNNSNNHIAGGYTGASDANEVPRILTNAYKDSSVGSIIENGFIYEAYSSSAVVYYIAIKI